MNTASFRLHATLAVAPLALLLCASAQAQSVRKCQIDGHTVFQSSPCPVEARVAPAAPQAAAIDASATPKKKALADLLRERDGADRVRPKAREFQGDGANILRSRMGAI
ncbi:MAG: hypothetical protein V4569_10540 [Pseudomonadota bacterium]